MNLAAVRSHFEHWLHRQWQYRGTWAWLMAPVALIFGLILKVRGIRYAHLNRLQNPLTVPLLVVGNIYIGGTGKTPVVIALIKQLGALGWQPGVISRGYGTDIGQHPLLGQGLLDAHRFGDEPALIARETGAPIAVHPNRRQACLALIKQYPHINLVISDDGLQHLRLPRDIELVVQDERGVGNGWLLPAGPLREPVSRLNTVHAVLTRTNDISLSVKKQSTLLAVTHHNNARVRKASISLVICRFRHLQSGDVLDAASFLTLARDHAVAAVAGIAAPERFFMGLRQIGLSLLETLALPDHFSYTQSPFSTLNTGLIVITDKDAVKCQSVADNRIWVAEVEMTFSDPEFLTWLDQLLQAKASRQTLD